MTLYAQEFELEDKPDITVYVVGPHSPPLPEELTLGMGLIATAAQIRVVTEAQPISVPRWPY